MNDPIYTPKGAAREYSPYALNLYLTCGHGCKYCYAPRATHKKDSDFHVEKAKPRDGLIPALEKQLSKLEDAGTPITEQVLMSFVGDCYGPSTDNNEITRNALEVLNRYDVPTAILTKNPMGAERDIDIIKKFNQIQIGTTFVFIDPEYSKMWEPNAPLPEERFKGLHMLKKSGIRTFVSMEPVIYPMQSLTVIHHLLIEDITDTYKLGKLNGPLENSEYVHRVPWDDYLNRILPKLRESGKEVYVKNDLGYSAPDIEYQEHERDADYHTVRRTA